jgi:hypothetical protein
MSDETKPGLPDRQSTQKKIMMLKDFTPMKETISLHGLGFIQVILPGEQRLHVWHPDLPRRTCYAHSAIHNHRFGFISRVLKGTQRNVRVDLELARGGTHSVISHNGPRRRHGGRLSYPVAECNVYERGVEIIEAGQEYEMPELAYHHTPIDGVAVTLMRKHSIGRIHANSICAKGFEFDYEFDRFQLSHAELWAFVVDALSVPEAVKVEP